MTPPRKTSSGKSGRKVRVAFRRNRQKPARDKDWTRQAHQDGGEAMEDSQVENVVAKGQLSRKRTIIEGAIHPVDAASTTGVVVTMHGISAEVDDGQRIWSCVIRRILRTRLIRERSPIAVGDRVRISIVADRSGVEREGVIDAIEPRRGTLTRVAGKRLHTVAANVDLAVIVTSAALPPFKPQLIDRYIVAAHHGRIEPVICLNKVDLDEDGAAREELGLYAGLGYRTLATSTLSATGLEELRAVLTGKCSVIAGQSGVGKSSLLNRIDPDLKLRVGEICRDTDKGRHTTTKAVLLRLAGGGYVVDTPGVRSFDISGVPPGELEKHFVDLAAYVPNCRFADCTHRHEPDCAVKAAVVSGFIAPQRYESYCRLYEERFQGYTRLKDLGFAADDEDDDTEDSARGE